MAWTDVTCCVCGREARVQMYGTRRERERHAAHWTCPECIQKQRLESGAKAASEASELGLPPLQGTDKQVAWAEKIRLAKWAEIERYFAMYGDELSDAAHLSRDAVAARTSASWWIDNRDYDGVRLMERELKQVERTAHDNSQEALQAMAEATLRPVSPVTETAAEMIIRADEIRIVFPEKREDFRLLVKERGFRWGDGMWSRGTKSGVGTIGDLLVETGVRLLDAGFIVRVFDEGLRRRIAAGKYEPESTRVIQKMTAGPYQNWFSLSWGKDEDFYDEARRLRGSRYAKPSVVVPADQFEEVLGFAQAHGFTLSRGATKLAESMREARASALQVDPEVIEPAAGDKQPDLDPSSAGDVHEDLRDDPQD